MKFEWPQPKEPYPPSERSGAFIGASGVGKTTTAIAMLTDPYKDVYSRVDVSLVTHDANGITALDVALATVMDDVFNRYTD